MLAIVGIVKHDVSCSYSISTDSRAGVAYRSYSEPSGARVKILYDYTYKDSLLFKIVY
jgi:hypothetical protein